MKEQQAADWRNAIDIADQTETMLSKMTLDEKIELVTGDVNYNYGFYNAAIERLGIPALAMADGPPGIRIADIQMHDGKSTALPAPIGLAATWDLELARAYGHVLGHEARASGHNVFLGPAVDIARVPGAGRAFESSGEDPILNARMAAAEIEAVQSHGVIACLKHIACNNQEYERYTIDAVIDEAALRELYLLPFEVVVKQTGIASLMGAFNKVNGVFSCENSYLLTDLLREEWGFKGWVMSDFGATHSTVPTAMAGLDQEQPSGNFYAGRLKEMVEQNEVPAEVLDTMCRRILRTILGLGLNDGRPDRGDMNTAEHRLVARRVCEESIVLLKNNEGFLPRDPKSLKRVLVVGVDADNATTAGGGSGKVRPVAQVSVLEGLRQHLGSEVEVLFAQGYDPISAADLLPGANSVPSGFLRTPDGERGIRASFWNNLHFSGDPISVMTMPQASINLGAFNFKNFVAYSERFPDVPLEVSSASAVRVEGRILVPVTGQYRLSFATLGSLKVWIDGKLVLSERNMGQEPDSSGDIQQEKQVEMGAIVGSGAVPGIGGVGVAGGNPKVFDVALDLVASEHGHDLRIEHQPDAPSQGFLDGAMLRMGWTTPVPLTDALTVEAVALSKEADLVVVVTRVFESEHADRNTIVLPNNQVPLLRALSAANPNVVVVNMSGGPIETESWDESVPAILHTWYPGQEQGAAIANVIMGDVNPSGRLVVSFPRNDDSVLFHDKSVYPGVDGRVHYSEGVMSGYRGHTARGLKPAYAFGFGLSYTSFEYSNLVTEIVDDGLVVSFDLENTGKVTGKEVAQLYIGLPVVGQPSHRLADFQKVSLDPGETRTVRFHLRRDGAEHPFGYWRDGWQNARGPIRVLIGKSAEDIILSTIVRL